MLDRSGVTRRFALLTLLWIALFNTWRSDGVNSSLLALPLLLLLLGDTLPLGLVIVIGFPKLFIMTLSLVLLNTSSA
jgi:hypothetical protein